MPSLSKLGLLDLDETECVESLQSSAPQCFETQLSEVLNFLLMQGIMLFFLQL